MNAVIGRVASARQPGFFCREAQDWREPGGQAIKQGVQDRQRGETGWRIGAIAIQTIFADIEIKRG